MCGIVGIQMRKRVHNRSHMMHRLKNMFTDMLVRAQRRGSAATGVSVATWPEKEERPHIWVLRSPTPASEFVETDDYKKLMAKVDNNCLSIIGHTRAVSGGASAANNRNNHPHLAGNVIGVHNGRIFNDRSLWRKYDHIAQKGTCDSEVIFAIINDKVSEGMSTEEAIAETSEELDGWFALALINARETQRVYLVKDKRSPLEFGWWDQPEAAVFASEWGIVTEAYKKAGTSTTYNTDYMPINRCEFSPNQVITLDSVLRGKNWRDFYVGRRSLDLDDAKTDRIIKDNEEAFKTTQGH